jgi:hypothetical protein
LYQSENTKIGEAVEPERIYAPTTHTIPSKAPPISASFILLVIPTPSEKKAIINIFSVYRLISKSLIRIPNHTVEEKEMLYLSNVVFSIEISRNSLNEVKTKHNSYNGY